jgi:hypothetical protein
MGRYKVVDQYDVKPDDVNINVAESSEWYLSKELTDKTTEESTKKSEEPESTPSEEKTAEEPEFGEESTKPADKPADESTSASNKNMKGKIYEEAKIEKEEEEKEVVTKKQSKEELLIEKLSVQEGNLTLAELVGEPIGDAFVDDVIDKLVKRLDYGGLANKRMFQIPENSSQAALRVALAFDITS